MNDNSPVGITFAYARIVKITPFVKKSVTGFYATSKQQKKTTLTNTISSPIEVEH